MALTDSTWYLNFGDGSTTGYYAITRRPQNTAVVAGQIVRQFTAPATNSERVFICIVAGTTANVTDATWAIARGTKTTDGTATWQECSGQAAINGDLTNTKTWAEAKAATPAVLGQIIKRSNNASYQICTTAGVMSASEPAFSNTAGVTTTDTTAVWTSLGSVSNFTGGQAPLARLFTAFSSGWFASGHTIYVGDNHAETVATALALSPASALMARILCHNHSGSYPPAASDITTGATISTTAISGIQFTGQGSFYFYGITFKSFSGPFIGGAAVGQTQNWYYFDNCSWWNNATGSTGGIGLGASSTAWGVIIFNNTTVKFGHVNQSMIPSFAHFTWQNTGSILASGSSVPTSFIKFPNASGCFNNIVFNNLDLSQLTGSLFNNIAGESIGTLIVQDCKLNAAMTDPNIVNAGMNVQFIRSDSAGTSYKSARYAYEGAETTETSIVRTNGAVDPIGQAQSRKIATTVNAQWLRPFKAEPMVIWNAVTGTNRVVTVYGVADSALVADDELWLEVEYLGSATDPLGKIVTTTKASVLASNAVVSSDSSTWNLPAYPAIAAYTPADVSVSGQTLTHSTAIAGRAAGITSSNYKLTGKFYVEALFVTSHGTADMLGVVNNFDSQGTIFSTGGAGAVVFASGAIWANATNTGKSLGTFGTGDVVAVVVDVNVAANRRAWFRKLSGGVTGLWNGDATADPTTGVGGVLMNGSGSLNWLPVAGFGGTGTAINDQITLNFSQSPYAMVPPFGFSNWDALIPFKLVATLSSPQPQLPGYLHARVRAAKASAIYYIDPKVELT